MLMKKFAAVAICCTIATAAVAQESKETTPAKEVAAVANKVATPDAQAPVKVMLNEEGALEGTAVLEQTKKAVADTKVTLTAEGKVVNTVKANEDGTFSFANVAPGAYQILGSSDGFVGSASYDVVPFAQPAVGGCSSCSVGMASAPSDVVYDSYASQPVSSFSSCNACSPCNTCGGGLGGGRLGGGLGSRLGGRLLSNGRIGLIGLAGLAGLGGDDSSPDR
jgi:hypothetical protein